jgi:hypothetical protein
VAVAVAVVVRARVARERITVRVEHMGKEIWSVHRLVRACGGGTYLDVNEPKSSKPLDELVVEGVRVVCAVLGAAKGPLAGGGDSIPLGGASNPPPEMGFGAELCVVEEEPPGASGSSSVFLFFTA